MLVLWLTFLFPSQAQGLLWVRLRTRVHSLRGAQLGEAAES